MIYYDMDDYRQRLIDERKKIEELLKAGRPAVGVHIILLQRRFH